MLVLCRGLALLLTCLKPVSAIDPTISTFQYLHTSWTQEEGTSLPAVQALAQTSDGYLWLGTGQGLIRFDGLRFAPWEAKPGEELPGGGIRSLWASSQGGLWISTAQGVARIDHDRVFRYRALDRWMGDFALAMVEDHAGNLWIAGNATGGTLGMLRRDGSLRVYDPSDGLPDRKVLTLFEDSRSNLWLGTHDGLCRWSPGALADCSFVPNLTVQFIAEGADGDLIIGDGGAKRVLRLSGGKLRPILDRLGGASLEPRLLTRDRAGNVWVGTAGQGLLRLRGAGYERLTRHEGLSSDSINALLEDREGNLWVGTAKGIDRFREPKILHVSTLDGLSSDTVTAVHTRRSGGVWIGTGGGGLDLVDGDQISHYLTDSGLPSGTVESLHEDARGRLWVGTTGGLVHRSENRFVEVRDPDGQHLTRVFAIAEDRTGTLILADGTKGLFSLREGVVNSLSVPGSEKKNVYQLLAARSGVLWVGYYQGGITAVAGDSARFYDTAQGLAQGAVQAIYEDRGGTIWVGTGKGLSRFRSGRWTTWTAKQGLPEGGVHGIVEDDRNGLWLMAGSGILSLPLAVLNASPDGSPGNLEFTLYGLAEGLRLANSGNMANPRIAKSNDGRLWVCTEDGVAVIDPGRIRGNPVPPPVVIEQLLVDGRPVDTSPVSGIVFRGRQVQIVYTGLSLTVPESVRFRRKLEGLDPNWTEAGTRRYVDYVNLPPGKYAFRVLACNNEGVWNTTGARLAFQIAPQFYQHKWFVPLCVGVAALLVWGTYLLRVRRLVSRFQLVAKERARMTRELHDSLLQGFAGVIYQLEAASRLFESNPEVSKRRLDHAIDQADESLREARRAIMSMRLPELEDATLPEALNAAGARAIEGSSIAFHLAVKGHVRMLPYEVQANMYLVGREAIANSVNHASAKRIAVQLVYSAKTAQLVVQDDGIGFDLEAAMAKKDHRGVIGMHERAKHIGATLTVDTASGKGTRIEFSAPLKT